MVYFSNIFNVKKGPHFLIFMERITETGWCKIGLFQPETTYGQE